jgi:hypothetical protein
LHIDLISCRISFLLELIAFHRILWPFPFHR